MRIVIDLQGAQSESRFRGIGRYSMSFAKAVVRNRGEHEIILALSDLFPETIEPIRATFDGLLPQENIRVWYAPGPIKECESGNKWRREVAELARETYLASLNPDVIHVTSLFEGYVDDAVTSIGRFDKSIPVSVSLYDLIPLINPDQYLKPNPSYEQYYMRKVGCLRSASLLLSISESSRNEGIKYLVETDTVITNISTAADAHFCSVSLSNKEKECLQEKFGINRPFVLYTGGVDERKNLPRLIRAYSQLTPDLRQNHQLVFAGKMPAGNQIQLRNEAKKTGLKNNEYCFTGYVSDKELLYLYNLCQLFVFPSWHEGFGLPALEAMACGAAVIGANTSSIPEVVRMDAALFDPYSEKSITEKMSEALNDKYFHQRLIKHGVSQAKNFSWDQVAKRAIEAFERLYQNRKVGLRRSVGTHKLLQEIARNVPLNCEDQNLLELSVAIAQNQPIVGEKQLLVDVSELLQKDSGTGVQRVTRSVLMELINRPPFEFNVKPVYATVGSDGYHYAEEYFSGLFEQEAMVSNDPIIVGEGDIFLGLDLQHHVVIAQADYFEKLKKQNVAIFFILYDLLPVVLAKYFPKDHSVLHAKWLDVVSRFDGLVCISKTVAFEVKQWLDVNFPARSAQLEITYFSMGADIENSVPSKGLPLNSGQILSLLKKSISFLMVGTLEPRKGQKQTLLAFEQLWEKGIEVNLVLVGRPGWMVDDLIGKIQSHPKLGKRLFWLDGISDEYLEEIYAATICLIAASEGEGFGLPLIEAAQHKLPIIARDIPVFREVAGNHAYYFSGGEAGDLAGLIEKWLNLYTGGEGYPVSDNMPWVTWKQSVDCLVRIILSGNNRRADKQILVDVSELVEGDVKSGIQRVVRSLLKELMENTPEGYLVEVVYATTEQGYCYARNFKSDFIGSNTVIVVDEPIEFQAGDIFLGLDLQLQVVTEQQTFYQKLRRNGVRVLFMVHDLLIVRHPEWFPTGSDDLFSQWLKVITQTDGAICVSNTTANDLQIWIDENSVIQTRPFHIYVSHNGGDIENSKPSYGMPSDAEVTLEVVRENTSFLMVGTIEPRKGYVQVLAAFERLWADGVSAILVLVGKQGWLLESFIVKIRNHPELARHLFLLEGISDEYLEKVYGAATCLIAASEGEGFGLPLIEAAQHKLPIIARDIPVFREVAGQYAYYFKGSKGNTLAMTIMSWLKLYKDNKHPKSDTMPWLTWKQSAQQLMEDIINTPR